MNLTKAQKNRIAFLFESLTPYINRQQLVCIVDNCRSEEGQFFIDKMEELCKTIKEMPGIGDTSEMKDPIVHLHYFIGSCDWHITETGKSNLEAAFGYCDLGMGCPELGYVSIQEILENDAEIDLYWVKKPLSQVMK